MSLSLFYLGAHVLAAPVGLVRLGVGLQDVVEVRALWRRRHVAVQNGRRSDVLGVEPAVCTDRHSHLLSTAAFTWTGATHTEVLVLAVGVFAFDQVRSLQRNTCEQSSGPGVGEDGRRAAQSHVRLHVPDRQEEQRRRQVTLSLPHLLCDAS